MDCATQQAHICIGEVVNRNGRHPRPLHNLHLAEHRYQLLRVLAL